MWKVAAGKLKIQLPAGFRLKEDPHFVYLFYRNIQVAVFSATGVNPQEIVKEAEKYFRERS